MTYCLAGRAHTNTHSSSSLTVHCSLNWKLSLSLSPLLFFPISIGPLIGPIFHSLFYTFWASFASFYSFVPRVGHNYSQCSLCAAYFAYVTYQNWLCCCCCTLLHCNNLGILSHWLKLSSLNCCQSMTFSLSTMQWFAKLLINCQILSRVYEIKFHLNSKCIFNLNKVVSHYFALTYQLFN